MYNNIIAVTEWIFATEGHYIFVVIVSHKILEFEDEEQKKYDYGICERLYTGKVTVT